MKIGNLLVNAAYLGERVLTAIAVGATKVWEGVSKYIKFADPVVEQICMKWSSDGIGLTPEDAAKVTDIGTTFSKNAEITSFEELEKFVGIVSTPKDSFYLCNNLKKVRIPSNVTSIIWSSFNGCTSLIECYLPVDSNLEVIDQWAFKECSSLRYLNIPHGVTTIGNEAFNNCSTLAISELPHGLTNIGKNSFSNCSSITSLIIHGGLKKISEGAFRSCASLVSLTIEEGVEILDKDSFYNCPKLSTVHTPSSVVHLGISCFNSTSLQEIIIPSDSHLSEIGERAFYTTKLKHIEIPSRVTIIGWRAFCGNSLGTFVIKAIIPPTLAGEVFAGTPSTMKIYVPDESVDAYKSATNWSAYADRIKPLSEYQPTNE